MGGRNPVRFGTLGWFTQGSGVDQNELPQHIERTVAAIARLHEEHRQQANWFQRTLEGTIGLMSRLAFLAALTVAVLAWMGANMLAASLGYETPDPPPFYDMQCVLALSAVYITLIILGAQQRADKLAAAREQLTLELAILGEQKTAKVIELLEQLRKDDPLLNDQKDDVAEAMAEPADPDVVRQALKDAHGIEHEPSA